MDKEALVERKNIGNKLEIRISIRERYIEDGISFYRNQKEILFIYILDNKMDYKSGKDYDENLAAMPLQNKYVVDAIDEVLNSDGLLCGKAVIYHTDIYCLVNNIFNNVKKGVRCKLKEVFSVEMKKSKEFEDGKLDSIKIEANISRHLEFDESKELFVGLNKEESSQSLGLVIIERYNLSEDDMLCEKAYRIDVVPYYKAEQNLYRFLNGRVVFERIIKEMVELMGRADKTNSTMLFDFDCDVDTVKAKLIQAMEIEAERELKRFARDRFFNKEEVIVNKYKGADE